MLMTQRKHLMVFDSYVNIIFLLRCFVVSFLLPLYISSQSEKYCSKNNCDKVEKLHLKHLFHSQNHCSWKRPLEIWFPTTFLPLNWRDTDQMDKELTGWLCLKSYSQQLHVQMETSNKWLPLKGPYQDQYYLITSLMTC